MTKLIAITGGIGSGKSVVSRILEANSYAVYNCDTEAKRLMDSSNSIQQRLTLEIHPDAVKKGIIDRNLIAKVVFNDPIKLQKLNEIVHSAVIDDIKKRTVSSLKNNILFIETAIPYQSNIDLLVDEIWEVTAPLNTRIQRVMRRNSCTHNEVLSRISAQQAYIPSRNHRNTKVIINDGINPVLPNVLKLLKECL